VLYKNHEKKFEKCLFKRFEFNGGISCSSGLVKEFRIVFELNESFSFSTATGGSVELKISDDLKKILY
jgi:hypothetical protein